MDWLTVKNRLTENIKVGSFFDENSHIREVIEIPASEKEAFKVKIAEAGTSIFVSMEMLQNIFEATLKNGNNYDKSVIYNLYPKQVDTHSCYVHVIGQLFKYAGVMEKVDHRNFKIIK